MLQQIQVYFNNGASAIKPWHVAGCEGKAMATDYGRFKSAETAISKAVEIARSINAKLIVPEWLQGTADEIALMNGVLDSMRPNGAPAECKLADQWLNR